MTDKEIIVVDSGSTDGTLEILRKYPVKCYEIPFEAFTYGYALNYGFERAKGEYVASLSAHAIPLSERWLEMLLAGMGHEERISGVMGRNLPYPDCNPFDHRELLRPERACPQQLTESTPFTFSNANCLIRKELWEKFPFNESLPASEDEEWARRVRAGGYLLNYIPDAAVFHSHNETLRQTLKRFYIHAYAESEMGKNVNRSSLRGLCARAAVGTFVDWGYILRRRFSMKWLFLTPLRRAVILYARLKGSRRIPFSTTLLQVCFERPSILFIKRVNEISSEVSAKIASWIRRSPYPVHPKYLIQGNGTPFWFEEVVEGKESFLDVGSDLGSQTLAAGRRTRRAVGFDIRKERVLLAERRRRDKKVNNVFFYVGNAETDWPFRSNTFDVLLMSDVLEHLYNERRALEESYRVLKPEGMLFLTLPNQETSWKRKQLSLGICPFSDRDHKREYREADLQKWLKEHRFELVDLRSVVVDTPWAGLMDLVGALNLSWYRRFAQWKQRQVTFKPKETTGFRIIAKKAL